jgi:iron complex outermembrane recepter protein
MRLSLKAHTKTKQASLAAIMLALASHPAHAQESAPKSAEVEVVIVTAQKRSQNLQDVPLSITAVGSKDILRLGGDKFSEFLVSIPGVAAIDQGSDFTNVVVRGVTTSAEGESDEGAVSVYFDEFPIGGGNNGVQLKPVDIERVEVLRGPQATLYGAGSLSGTIHVVPSKPNLGKFLGGLDFDAAHTSGARSANHGISGYINIPLIDDVLGMRVAGFTDEDQGFVNNIRLGKRIGNQRAAGARWTGAYRPSQSFEINVLYAFQQQKGDGAPQYYPLFAEENGLSGFNTSRNREGNLRRSRLAGVTLKAEFGSLSLVTTSGYRSTLNDTDIDFSIASLILADDFGINNNEVKRTKSWNNEVRLSSRNDGPFNFLVGAYFERRRSIEQNEITRIDTGSIYNNYPFGAPLQARASKGQETSIFGEVELKVKPNLTLAAGIRQTQFDLSGTLSPLGAPSQSSQKKPKSTNPQVTLSYEPSPAQTFYLRAARGFRAPDIVFPESSCDVSTLPSNGVLGPDSLINYELGSKSRLAGGKVQFNASTYLVDWKDIPVFSTANGCSALVQVNGGQARSYGVELEVTARITPNLTVNGSATFNNSRLRSVLPGFTGGERGDKLPGTADVRVNVGASYERDINANMSGFVNTSISYIGPYTNQLPNSFADQVNVLGQGVVRVKGVNNDAIVDPKSGDYFLVNSRVGIRTDRWTVSAYVNNLFDSGRRVLIAPNAADGLLELSFVPSRPRTLGIALSTNF